MNRQNWSGCSFTNFQTLLYLNSYKMSKIADLYIRVSTDEQADKGYSQRNQEEMLRKYCNINSLQVRQVIFEDHSPKALNRPEFKILLFSLKSKKHTSALSL